MMNRGFGFGFGGFGAVWWLLGIVCLVSLIVLVAWLIGGGLRSSRRPPEPPAQPWQQPAPPLAAPAHPKPNEILRERFARGEITAEEFQRARDLLGPD